MFSQFKTIGLHTKNKQKINNISIEPFPNDKFPCLHTVSITRIASEVNPYCFVKCMFEQTELIYPAAKTSRASHFLNSTDATLSVVSVNMDLIKCDASAAAINLCRLFFFFRSLSAAHLHPSIPLKPADWQQHNSRGCIKNTLGQRKKLRLDLSDRKYLLQNELSANVLMHHHRVSVVTYGLAECTPRHF